MAKKQSVGGSVVRAWAKGEGAEALAEAGLTIGDRGVLGEPVLKLFHAANPRVKYEKGHVEPRQIKGTRVSESGRKTPVTVKATLPEVRAWATGDGASVLAAEGLTVGAKGRIAAPVLAAFAARPKA